MAGWLCEVDLRRDDPAPGTADDRTVLTAYRSTELGALLGAVGLVLAGHREQIAAEFDQVVKLAGALGLDKLTDATSDSDQHAADGALVVRGPDESELYRIPPGPRGDTADTRLLPQQRDRLVQALRLTVEYVGLNTLKPRHGWTWFDALSEIAPDVAQAFVKQYEHNAGPEEPSDDPTAGATEVQLRHGMTRLLHALKERGDSDPKQDVIDQVLALFDRGDKALIELDRMVELHDDLSRQTGQLATYIMDEIPGEPSQDEGAVECAVRLLKQWRQDSSKLNSIGHAVAVALGEVDKSASVVVANPAELVNRLIDDYRCLAEQQATDIAEARTDEAESEEP